MLRNKEKTCPGCGRGNLYYDADLNTYLCPDCDRRWINKLRGIDMIARNEAEKQKRKLALLERVVKGDEEELASKL